MPTSIRFCWIIHEVRKFILYLAHAHRANIWSTKLQHVFWHCIFVSVLPLICWFPTFSLPSHIQPYGTEPGHCDKYFPWQCQHEFPFTCARVCGCVRSLPSEVIPICSHSYQTVAITRNLSGYKSLFLSQGDAKTLTTLRCTQTDDVWNISCMSFSLKVLTVNYIYKIYKKIIFKLNWILFLFGNDKGGFLVFLL